MAVVGAQSGKKLASVSATVTIAVTKNEDEAITFEDGMLVAVATGKAEITAKSELAGLSGKLKITVTNPVDKIMFMVGDDEHSGEEFLAVGEKTEVRLPPLQWTKTVRRFRCLVAVSSGPAKTSPLLQSLRLTRTKMKIP